MSTHPPISPHHAIYLCLCVVKLRNSEARARGQVDRPAAPASVPVILRSLPLPSLSLLSLPPPLSLPPLPPTVIIYTLPNTLVRGKEGGGSGRGRWGEVFGGVWAANMKCIQCKQFTFLRFYARKGDTKQMDGGQRGDGWMDG